MNAPIKSVLACAILVSGCATSYQSNGFTGGYMETQLAPDVYRVVFRGNGFTRPDRAQDLALLRASQLTLQHGFTHFAIIDQRNSTSISSFTTPGHIDTTTQGTGYSSGNIYLNPYGATYSGSSSAQVNSRSTFTPPETHIFYKPETGIMLRMLQTKPDGFFAYDAAFLQESLKKVYRIK